MKNSSLYVNLYDVLRIKQPTVEGWKVVSFSLAIPFHFFVFWLVIEDALITREKMCKWGLYRGQFLFCRGRMESRAHVFFQYSFSKRVWRELMKYCLILSPCVEGEEVIQRCIDDLQSKSLKTSLCKMSFEAVVYQFWKQMNEDLLHGSIPKTEAIVDRVRWEICVRIMAKCIFKMSAENLELIRVWNLPQKALG
jgi:hypothetical protein